MQRSDQLTQAQHFIGEFGLPKRVCCIQSDYGIQGRVDPPDVGEEFHDKVIGGNLAGL
jgi:hypothetical protein